MALSRVCATYREIVTASVLRFVLTIQMFRSHPMLNLSPASSLRCPRRSLNMTTNNIGSTNFVPLAPPAASKSSTQQRFTWSTWLSPKIARPRPHHRRDNDDMDDDSPRRSRQQQQRPRRASFDEPIQNTRSVDNEDSSAIMSSWGSDNTWDDSRSSDQQQRSPRSTTNQSQSLLTSFLLHLNGLLPEYCNHLSHASDITSSDGASRAIRVLEKGGKTLSLSEHLSPSKTVAQLQSSSPITPSSSANTGVSSAPSSPLSLFKRNTPATQLTPKSDSANSPFQNIQQWLSPASSPKSRRDNRINEKNVPHLPGIPRSAPSSPYSGNPILFGQGLATTRRNSVAESEWERFISPFLMLAGAEVLYGRMEHVIDPESQTRFESGETFVGSGGKRNMDDSRKKSNDKHDNEVKSGRNDDQQTHLASAKSMITSFFDGLRRSILVNTDNETTNHSDDTAHPLRPIPSSNSLDRAYSAYEKKPTLVKFAMQHLSPRSVPINVGLEQQKEENESLLLVSSYDPTKRGSRRLISMYRQIREELIIVSEYLVDPVLGARSNGNEDGPRGLSRQYPPPRKLPPPPLHIDQPTSITSSSDLASRIRLNPSCSQSGNEGVPPEDEQLSLPSADDLRERAALSLRQTLDAIIEFTDARCVLIRLHAELCTMSSQNNDTGKRCAVLSEQCNSVRSSIPDWASLDESMVKLLLARLEREVKAMELALITVKQMSDCK